MVNSWLILENQQHRNGDLIGFDPEKRWNYMVLFDFYGISRIHFNLSVNLKNDYKLCRINTDGVWRGTSICFLWFLYTNKSQRSFGHVNPLRYLST